MPTITPNLKLTKPLEGEGYDINVFNSNFDKIDALELVDTKIKVTDAKGNFTATTLDGVLDEVFISVDNGKTILASAITDRGVQTSKDDTFQKMESNIRNIPVKEVTSPRFEIGIGVITAIIDTQGFFTEFKLDNGQWQSGNVFENLSPVQSYTFYAKNINYISSIKVTTPKANQTANMPMPSEIKHDRVTITASTGERIRFNGVDYTSPYTFTGLKANTQYKFYGVKPSTDKLNEGVSSPLTVTTTNYPVFGFRIDVNNSNPLTKISYIKDAIGIAPATSTGYGGWENKFIFDRVKPCGFKNGKKTEYINPSDFTKYVDGISVPDDVDIMIEFPKIYWKWTTQATYIDVELSEGKIDSGFECLAHTVGTVEKDYIYLGAYLGYEENGKLRSKKGVLPTANKTIGQFRTLAQANGTGYQQYVYYSMFMLQMLFVLMYRSTDSQTSLGYGYANGNNSSITTGNTYNKGMNFGESTGKQQMKFLGIEDFWGNLYQWVDGLYCDSSRNILITDNSVFNDNGSGYVNYGQGAGSSLNGGYIDAVQGKQSTGFISKSIVGSNATHYCDYGYLAAGCLGLSGGIWNSGLLAGAFSLYVNYSASDARSHVGARLCYI